jgi:hypothetical protein
MRTTRGQRIVIQWNRQDSLVPVVRVTGVLPMFLLVNTAGALTSYQSLRENGLILECKTNCDFNFVCSCIRINQFDFLKVSEIFLHLLFATLFTGLVQSFVFADYHFFLVKSCSSN